ncbi:nucleotidyltransferase domain-containing protein [Cohnella sp. 56]|uniref:nucleotidyltransferase domain-containing protein n=1 Tax=Cohnella sp. 56 TaxID=3113722 RepID=UPI0030E84198
MELEQEGMINAVPRELRLILMLLRSPHHPSWLTDVERLVAEEIDWNFFIELTQRHRIYPTLERVIRENATLLPLEATAAIKKLCMTNVFQMLQLTSELDRINRIFEENHVRALSLKGPGLAYLLHGDISQRTSKDLDILVPIVDFERAEALLLQAGYKVDGDGPRILNEWKYKRRNDAYYHPEKGIQIELHWRLYANLGKEPTFEELWTRKKTVTFSNMQVHILNQEDLFFYLVIHGAKHAWFRLRWLEDIARLINLGFDWERTLRMFETYHCSQLAGQALIMTSDLFGTPLTASMRRLTLTPKSKALARETLPFINAEISVEGSRQFNRYWYHMLSHRHKWAYLKRLLYPSFMDAQTLPLPRRLHFLYFPFRPFLWLWRRFNGMISHEAQSRKQRAARGDDVRYVNQ